MIKENKFKKEWKSDKENKSFPGTYQEWLEERLNKLYDIRKFSNTVPLVTVGLPLYKMQNIQWLAIEGLRRQETDIPFEVIICIEDDMMGDTDFTIDNPSCVGVRILKRKQWTPLPEKWSLLARYSRGDVFLLQSGDCYSDSQRINRAYRDIMVEGHDWTQDRDGWFYHIQKKRLLQFHQESNRTALNMAFLTSLGQDLPRCSATAGIDGWLCSSLGIKNPKWNINENKSVDTHGLNTISVGRGRYFDQVTAPFFFTEESVGNLLPEEVLKKLNELV